jgi:predicted SAM-dependent methyltransferase
MSHETSKATERRLHQEWPWDDVFTGEVLDVGPGDDPLQWMRCKVTPFDKEQGDANKIDEAFSGKQFDCIHGSQVMEHLHQPSDFIRRCLKILKPGGWIVMTVPDWDLYEKRTWPSRYNPDHKSSWSLWRQPKEVIGHMHNHVPTWIKQFNVHQRHAELIDTNYDYLAPDTKDQTWLREDGVECFIEILLQKHP